MGKSFIDDIVDLTGQAIEFGENTKNEIETYIRRKIEALASEMNLVTREEFDAWKQRFENLEKENQHLKDKITEFEEKLPKSSKTNLKTTK